MGQGTGDSVQELWRKKWAAAMLQNQVDFISTTHRSAALPVAYAAHFAEVEVDIETGLVQVVDFVAVHDVERQLTLALWKARSMVGCRWASVMLYTKK